VSAERRRGLTRTRLLRKWLLVGLIRLGAMPIERSNVPGLAQPPGYMHLATVSEARLVYIAGQVPLNERGELVGHGDAIAQVRQCLGNLAACLVAAGATPGDVVRTTVYVAAQERAVLERVWQALLDSELWAVVRTPATLLGVRHLGYEGQLVEIECTAALPLDQLGQDPG
jgi:enamine deaminase RidA (YjgF/YER057c/UK114 family)